MNRQSRRSFLFGAFSAVAGVLGWRWARGRDGGDGIPWPFRRVLRWNESVARRLFGGERVDTRPPAPAPGTAPRVNGMIGLDENALEREWRLEVGEREWTLAELRKLPRTETTAIFKCVEGWS